MTEQLAELDAAERVLSRIGRTKAAQSRRRSRAQSAEVTGTTAARGRRGRRARETEATAPAVPARRRGAGRGSRRARGKPEMPLGDATLRAIEALGNEISAEQVREYLGREFGMQVRPNHLGMALQRHRRAGRLQQHDGRWSLSPTGAT